MEGIIEVGALLGSLALAYRYRRDRFLVALFLVTALIAVLFIGGLIVLDVTAERR